MTPTERLMLVDKAQRPSPTLMEFIQGILRDITYGVGIIERDELRMEYGIDQLEYDAWNEEAGKMWAEFEMTL